MSGIEMELQALDKIIQGSLGIADEAIQRKADLKQGRLASEVYGRANAGLKTKLAYRLSRNKLIEMESKVLEATAADAPKIAPKKGAKKRIAA